MTLHHVSCSPSKIPYVGFSPVRLQIGIQLQSSPEHCCLSARPAYASSAQTYIQLKLPSQKRVCPQHYCRFIRPRATLNRDSFQYHPRAIQSRGPWLSGGLCCPTRSSLNMASSEAVCPSRRLIFFVHRVFALRPRMDWDRQIPQFTPRICDPVPSSVPRWSCRVHLTVTSPTVIAFAFSAGARQPQTHTRRFSRGCVTRLQSSLPLLRPGILLALHRQGRLRPSFRLMGHPNQASVITIWQTANYHSRTYTGKIRSIMGCEQGTQRDEPSSCISLSASV